MIIGEGLRVLWEQKRFSQGEIERRTGLLRCYTSRMENGHTVPAIETLEKYAQALEVSMYQLFYDGEEPPKPPKLPKGAGNEWGSSGKEARLLEKFPRLLRHAKETDRNMLLGMARQMAKKKGIRI